MSKKERTFHFLEGEVLLIDKPLEWTSFDVVKKLRFALQRKLGIKKLKVGHAGTLDPLATGLLIICTGRATKQIQRIQEQKKTYEGSLVLGAFRPSFDNETEIEKRADISGIDEKQLVEAARALEGTYMQMPPLHSAKRIGGKKAYAYARAGKTVELRPHPVVIDAFALTGISLPEIHFRIVCSKGTYVRSLVRDFGEALGNLAYMDSLRRTAIGDYTVEEALTPNRFVEMLDGIDVHQ